MKASKANGRIRIGMSLSWRKSHDSSPEGQRLDVEPSRRSRVISITLQALSACSKQCRHLPITYLVEVPVPLADGNEMLGNREADHIICFLPQALAGTGGSDGRRNDDSERFQ